MKRLDWTVPKSSTELPNRLDLILTSSPIAQNEKLSRSALRKLIVAGAVFVNSKRVRVASRTILVGSKITIYLRSEEVKRFDTQFSPEDLKVLYEDEDLIAFDKPAGLPTQPTLDEARQCLYTLAKKHLSSRVNAPFKDTGYLGLHHRLDRDTSGIVLFTKTRQINDFIGRIFKDHLCKKTYIAIANGTFPRPEGHIENFLDQVTRQGKKAKFGSVSKGGKKAITDYLVLSSNQAYTELRIRISTGRTHQIRVHLSELGHAVVGDTLYGPSSTAELQNKKLNRFLLHHHEFSFSNPEGKLITVSSAAPKEFSKWMNEEKFFPR